jgi:hypothetical protein
MQKKTLFNSPIHPHALITNVKHGSIEFDFDTGGGTEDHIGEGFMTAWRPNRLLKAILIWTAITLLLIWLPLVRGVMDGQSYAWGLSLWGPNFSGRGIEGDYWFVVLAAVVGLGLLYLGWRGAKPPFHWLLLMWHLPLAAGVTILSLRQAEDLRFRGDTLGIDVSLAWIGPLLFGGFALLALMWVVRDLRLRRQRSAPPWNRMNRALLATVIALIPAQFVLLRFGEPDGTADQAGVILTILQWVLLNLAFVPWQTRGDGRVGFQKVGSRKTDSIPPPAAGGSFRSSLSR